MKFNFCRNSKCVKLVKRFKDINIRIIRKNKRIRLFLYKSPTVLLFIIAYILYFFSLEGCFEGEEICGNNLKWIYKKVFEIIISCELISFLLALIIFNYSTKLHLIHLAISFALFYRYSNDFYFANHGMYNIILFLLLLFIIFFIIILL